MGDTVLLLQPVVPFGLVIVRSKPPWNQPQESPAEFSKLPTLVPPRLAWNFVAPAQASVRGSPSPISVNPPVPSATSLLDGPFRLAAIPLVCPEIRLTAP